MAKSEITSEIKCDIDVSTPRYIYTNPASGINEDIGVLVRKKGDAPQGRPFAFFRNFVTNPNNRDGLAELLTKLVMGFGVNAVAAEPIDLKACDPTVRHVETIVGKNNLVGIYIDPSDGNNEKILQAIHKWPSIADLKRNDPIKFQQTFIAAKASLPCR